MPQRMRPWTLEDRKRGIAAITQVVYDKDALEHYCLNMNPTEWWHMNLTFFGVAQTSAANIMGLRCRWAQLEDSTLRAVVTRNPYVQGSARESVYSDLNRDSQHYQDPTITSETVGIY